MATAAENIEALEKALANGKLTVTIDGQSRTYKSNKELIEAIQYFRNQSRSSKPFGVSVFKSV